MVETEGSCKRKPNTVTLYNTTKCGVEVMEQMVQPYSVYAGTLRWPMTVFCHRINRAALNVHLVAQACTVKQDRWWNFLVESWLTLRSLRGWCVRRNCFSNNLPHQALRNVLAFLMIFLKTICYWGFFSTQNKKHFEHITVVLLRSDQATSGSAVVHMY